MDRLIKAEDSEYADEGQVDEPSSKKQKTKGDPDDDEPLTRKALEAIRQSYSNTTAFLVDLYDDDFLQKTLQMVVMDLKELHLEFSAGQNLWLQMQILNVLQRNGIIISC